MDFGLARDAEQTPQEVSTHAPSALSLKLTHTGLMIGTPAYMSLEQFAGACDPRSDQYSFFVVAFETLFGRRPFEAETLDELIEQISSAQALVIPDDETIPLPIRSALARGLATDPEQRFDDMAAALTALSLDHARRRSWALPAIGATAIAALLGLTAWLSLAEPEDLCASAALAAQRAWDDQARESIRTAFKATEAPFAIAMAGETVAALDEVGREHAQLRREVCEATRVEATQSEALLDLRMRCLDSRRRRFESLISVLSAATVETAAKALSAIDKLPTAAECPEISLSQQYAAPSRESRAEVERLQQIVARASAEGTAGATARALELLEGEVLAVEALDYLPLNVEFYLELGTWRVQSLTGGAEAALLQALGHSVALGDDESSLRSLGMLVPIGLDSEKRDEADHRLMLFRSFMTRRGDHLSDQIRLEELLALMTGWEGDREASTVHVERALALQLELDPRNLVRLTTIHSKAGEYYLETNALDRADHHFRQAHELYVARFGADHPNAAFTLSALAEVASQRGEHERALLLHEKALRSFEMSDGQDNALSAFSYYRFATSLARADELDRSVHFFKRVLALTEGRPERAQVYHDALSNYGVIMWFAGRYEEALPLQEEILRLQQSKQSVNALELGIAEGNLASTLASLGRHEESLELHRSALARFEASLSPNDLTIAVALFDMAAPMIELGLVDEALSQLERAESIYAGRIDDTDPYVLAEVRVVMVEVLRASALPSKRERSEELADKVHAAAADLGPRGEELVSRLDAAGAVKTTPKG